MQQPVAKRSKEQVADIATYFRHRDVDYLTKRFAWIKAEAPLARRSEDAAAQKAALAKARATGHRSGSPLVQLAYKDVEMSIAQSADRRLTGAQDLTWALINNPAFLFNH